MNRFNERVYYDKNGNIKGLERRGRMQNGKYGIVDTLTIVYNGNQLQKVTDKATAVTYAGSLDFKGTKGTAYSYTYNENGSLLTDQSRGIAFIAYDLSGNPQKIYFTNGSITKYVYSASGQKLRVVHYTAVKNITRSIGQHVELTAAQIQSTDSTDYLLGGSLVVKNGKIDRYLFDGGYAKATASGTTDNFAFFYQNKDHLGTVRETVTSTGAMKQRVNYYPFGGQLVDTLKAMVLSPNFQQYKYNGKEFDNMYGLNTYDYGARQHYPVLARWDRIDPLCEKYYNVSPYAYCANNPVKYVDPDGRKIVFAEGVSKEFRNNFSQAVSYLNQHGCSGMLKALNDSRNTYYISESADGSNSFDYKSKTIQWNSQMGLKTTEDQYLSPTTLLNHEVDHALEYDKNPKQFKNNIKRYDDSHPDNLYYSPEEKRVITGSEQKTARALGEIKDNEVTRTDHSGYHVRMESTTSNTPIEKEQEFIIYPQRRENDEK